MTEDERDEIARILEIVAKDGLPEPRDLDVALDAIEAALSPPTELTQLVKAASEALAVLTIVERSNAWQEEREKSKRALSAALASFKEVE